MPTKKLKKILTKCLISSFLIFCAGAGCAKTVPEFVAPPLHDPPKLESLEPMAHPGTLKPGFWLDRADAQDLGNFFGHVRNIKEKWK